MDSLEEASTEELDAENNELEDIEVETVDDCLLELLLDCSSLEKDVFSLLESPLLLELPVEQPMRKSDINRLKTTTFFFMVNILNIFVIKRNSYL